VGTDRRVLGVLQAYNWAPTLNAVASLLCFVDAEEPPASRIGFGRAQRHPNKFDMFEPMAFMYL